MLEKTRIEVIDSIDNRYDELNTEISLMKKEIEDLERMDLIKSYLEMKSELVGLEIERKTFPADKNRRIAKFFKEKIDKDNLRLNCTHDLWIYLCSMAVNPMSKYADYIDGFVPCHSETHNNFAYNKYMCVECGKIVCEKDYKDFESKHKILKVYNPDAYIGLDKADIIQDLYYSKLYEMPSEEALLEVEKAFEEDELLVLKKRN